ncbi:MAG: signal recognition particle protein [Nanoarchaeota archaeon]|nr:signal recognition particle protein [Nanoarchaeota archaeon]
MLDKLSNALKKATDKIANAIFLDKNLVDSIVKDLQRALIEADVNVQLVLDLSNKIKKAALDERIKGIEKKEHIIKLLHNELLTILGEEKQIKLGKRNVFLMLGLYGAGKTTTISKLALYYSKRGKKVCAVGLDVHRPAASEQLKQLCDKLNIPAFIDSKEKDPLKIWKKYEKETSKYNLVLVDTAGRDALNKDLITEIKSISRIVDPTETFLVMPADIGQAAKTQAETFKEAVKITGVIITRMDSTAKAGGALTACAEIKVPVVFIGTGEKPVDLEHFNPNSFLSRLLGMGDLESLIEKVKSAADPKKLEETQKRLEEGKLNLEDFIEQAKGMGDIGSIDKIMSMIPGLGKIKVPESAKTDLDKLKRWDYIKQSMTEEEKNDPELLEKQTARIQRIAKGSGTTTSEIRMMLKQYKMIQEMVKSQSDMAEGKIDQKTLMKMAKKLGGKKMKRGF